MNLSLLPDNKKIDINSNDLLDRIINLKIDIGIPATKTEPAKILDSFVIRSDYELVFPDMSFSDSISSEQAKGRYIIRRCTKKPSIKVQCNMVTANLGTSVDVFISNFFILTQDGKHLRSFSADKYAVIKVEIAMGYWGQFEDDTMDIEKYYQINAVKGADKITMVSPIVVTTDKLPPDSVLHIHGYVGDIFSSPVAVSGIDSYDKASENPTTSSNSDLEELLYNQITKRYLKTHSVEAKSVSDSSNKLKLVEDTGVMTDSDADKLGVQVFLSSGAKEVTIDKKVDSDGTEQEAIVYFEAGNTIGQTISRIISSLDEALEYQFTTKEI